MSGRGMIQTRTTGSTISCLWPHCADHAGMPVMLPRKSDSDMCSDGSKSALVRSSHPVAEHGRVRGVSDPRHNANLAGLAWNRARLLVMEENRRWRRLAKTRPQIRGRDKSACPKRSKPLAWLAFSGACRPVAGILPEFFHCFQRFDMHGSLRPRPRAQS